LKSDQIDANSPLAFEYDLNDNRLRHSADDASRVTGYLYADDSNRLTRSNQFQSGDPQSTSPRRDLVYNDAGRLFELREGGILVAQYVYNDEGQRTRKTVFNSNGSVRAITIFHYDHSGYLITETTEVGDLIRDYLWLEGMIPVAQIDGNAGFETVTYLHTDHLMTNRLATDGVQQVVWRWEGEAFGNTEVQEIGATTINLRFPGQYFDEETGLHYNMQRYFDPDLGRYITSDPIGLSAGLNTYTYANVNPIGEIDPTGEIVPLLIAIYVAVEFAISAYDAYDTARTLLDPCETAGAKVSAAGLFVVGMVAPGGGYGQLRHLPIKNVTKRSADRRLRNADGTFAYDGGPKTRNSNSTHGNTRTGDTEATLYGKFDADGNFEKWGISQGASKRYSASELAGGRIKEYRRGPRDQMLGRERKLVERFPGPKNKEPWAGAKRSN
jgi:RHS repeat-associated protein